MPYSPDHKGPIFNFAAQEQRLAKLGDLGMFVITDEEDQEQLAALFAGLGEE